MTRLTTHLNRARHTLAAIVTWDAGSTAHRTRVRRAEHDPAVVRTGPADLGLALAVAGTLHAPAVRAPELATAALAPASPATRKDRHTRRAALRTRAVRG
jgi:hypothetical protein